MTEENMREMGLPLGKMNPDDWNSEEREAMATLLANITTGQIPYSVFENDLKRAFPPLQHFRLTVEGVNAEPPRR
jgi:hypothetical protein